MWSNYKDSKKANLGFTMEGQVPIYIFTETPTKVRFLTEDVKEEDIMSSMKMVREAAQEYIFTKLAFDKWIIPISHWEHQIKEIPGKRYFSTVVCRGRGSCPLCMENDQAKAMGVGENKLLPYPVRKRFVVPAYFFELNKVLFIRGSEEFFDDVATYINKNGIDCDFDIYKQGKGFNTKYKVVFTGKSEHLSLDWSTIPTPKQLDFSLTEQEWNRRIEGASGNGSYSAVENLPEAVVELVKSPEVIVEAKDDVGSFVIPFGSHKGKTIKNLFDLGEIDYLNFLVKNSSGLVHDKVSEFMKVYPF